MDIPGQPDATAHGKQEYASKDKNRLIFYFHINHNWTLNCNFLSLKSPIPSIIINTVFRFIKPKSQLCCTFLT